MYLHCIVSTKFMNTEKSLSSDAFCNFAIVERNQILFGIET